MRASLLLVALVACGPVAPSEATQGDQTTASEAPDASTASSSGEGPTTGAPTTGSPEASTTEAFTSDASATDASSSGGFIMLPDGGGGGCGFSSDPKRSVRCSYCDVWSQDCGDDFKCSPWDLAGDGFLDDYPRCYEVAADPKPLGAPCVAQVPGFDDCEIGAMCWNLDAGGEGVCVPLCDGSPRAPVCDDPATSCVIFDEWLLALCLPGCDPLVQDCPAGDQCVPNPHDTTRWACAQAVGPQAGPLEPCAANLACAPGLICSFPQDAVECDVDEAGCCQSLCDLTQPKCPGAGQTCVPWYPPGEAPAGLEDVGRCALP